MRSLYKEGSYRGKGYTPRIRQNLRKLPRHLCSDKRTRPQYTGISQISISRYDKIKTCSGEKNVVAIQTEKPGDFSGECKMGAWADFLLAEGALEGWAKKHRAWKRRFPNRFQKGKRKAYRRIRKKYYGY